MQLTYCLEGNERGKVEEATADDRRDDKGTAKYIICICIRILDVEFTGWSTCNINDKYWEKICGIN